jgi:hypothetical protein
MSTSGLAISIAALLDRIAGQKDAAANKSDVAKVKIREVCRPSLSSSSLIVTDNDYRRTIKTALVARISVTSQ